MRNKLTYILLAAVVFFTAACTDDFERINDDPNKGESIDPGLLLTRVWMRYNGSPHEEVRGNNAMAGPLSGIVQSAYRTGQAFQGNNDAYNEAKYGEMYKDAVKNGMQLLNNLEKDKENDNTAKTSIATVTMQFVFQRLTDLYGDIPYHNAGNGYINGSFYPEFDTQEDIYKSMVDTLKKHRDILMATDAEPFLPKNDIFFGNLDEQERNKAWAKTANSLIMRIGMNASAADEAWAKSTVEEAANNSAGYITTNEIGDAFIMQTSVNGGDWGLHVNGANATQWGHVYVGEKWLRLAQRNRDPRIFYVAAQGINNGAWSAWTDMSHFDAFEEAPQYGEPWKPVTFMPIKAGGTESLSIRAMYAISEEVEGEDEPKITKVGGDWYIDLKAHTAEYAQYHTVTSVNPETIGHKEAPIIVFGGDESYYILAEAKQRGWNVPGDVTSNLEKALELTFEKYPTLFQMDSKSPQTYLAMQSANEGVNLSYEGLQAEYMDMVMNETIDLELIWRERWKSLMTTFTYDAFTLWNRTNLSIISQGIPYPGTEFTEIPVYKAEQVEAPAFGQEIPTSEFTSQPFHNGGDTEGHRPRRINYPNSERTNNTENVEAAIQRQITEHGQVGNGSHFITTRMWISKQ